MSHVLQVDRNEWETFLSEFSALTKNYELILNKLELAHTQMKELSQRNESLTQELRRALSVDHSTVGSNDKRPEPDSLKEFGLAVQSKPGFLQAFRNRMKMSMRKPQNLMNSYASCQRCGFLIRRASRFCVGCGSDFGYIVCPCGRGLSSNDKFCDRCRRVTGLNSSLLWNPFFSLFGKTCHRFPSLAQGFIRLTLACVNCSL